MNGMNQEVREKSDNKVKFSRNNQKKGYIGLKYNYLEIIGFSNEKVKKYICKCDCGETRNISYNNLVNGFIKSCGCKNHEYRENNARKYEPILSSFRGKASNYKALAKKRKIEFTLSIEETINLLKGNCYYCDKPPSNFYNVRNIRSSSGKVKTREQKLMYKLEAFNILYNGIDRRDNSKGYIAGNVVSCCTQCNTAKMELTESAFKEWIINIYNKYIKNEDTPHI